MPLNDIQNDAHDLREAVAKIGEARDAIQRLVERNSFPQLKRVIRPDVALRDTAGALSFFVREADSILSLAGESVAP